MLKPMLATDADLSKIKFPVIVQPKIDGVRALVLDGKLVGRSLKPFKNKYATEVFSQMIYNGFDGEMIVNYDPAAQDLCRATTSALNTIEGDPNLTFYVFDINHQNTDKSAYVERLEMLDNYIAELSFQDYGFEIRSIPSRIVTNMDDLLKIFNEHIEAGYEGTMIKDPDASYKHGRVTVNQGQMLRVKQFEDSEIVVTKLEEAMKNNNEATINALGHTERSSHKANKEPLGMIGSIIGLDMIRNEEVTIGPGKMTHDERRYYWENQSEIIGKLVKYKFMPHGEKDKPRHATFQCFRMIEDT